MENALREMPHVVIIGAGFGGLQAAKKLACKDVRVTVIDRTNYHLFQPLLYQVATAALSPADIAAPVRAVLSKCKNMEVMLAEVQSMDVDARKIKTTDMEIAYDFLIVATGARHSYFGHNEWEKLAPGLKSLEDAIELRRRLLLAFEYAEKITDEAARKAAMTFVIIGGGPTGVEMAGAIAEIARYTLAKDFRHIDPSQARVILIEAEPRLLAVFPEDLSASAMKQLVALGVEVRTGTRATNLTETGLQVGDEFIPCRVKIWAAGNTASFVGKTLGAPRHGQRRSYHSRTSGSPGNWRSREFFSSNWAAIARRFTGRHATRPPCRPKHSQDDRQSQTAALPVLGQGKHGHDRTE